MPNRDDELSRDERDAVSAEELLRRLKGEMESLGVDKNKPEVLFKEDSHISEEASKTAKEEIVLGNPDEFGEDLESLMRMVMNMPAEEPEADETVEEVSEAETVEEETDEITSEEEEAITEGREEPESEVAEQTEEGTPGKQEPTEDTIVYSQLSFEVLEEDEDKPEEELAKEDEPEPEAEPEQAETAEEEEIVEKEPVIEEVTENYDDDEEILRALAKENETDSEPSADSEKSFLTEIARMVNEEVSEPIPDDDEFGFVTDTAKEDAPSEIYGEASVGEDGGREYSDINNNTFNSTEMSLLSLFGDKKNIDKEKAEKITEAANKLTIPDTPAKKKFYETFASDFEYISHEQDDEIKNRYSKVFGFTVVQFVLCIVFAALLFVIENTALFGITPPEIVNLSIYPVVSVMIDLQLVVLCAFMAYRSLSFVRMPRLFPQYCLRHL